MTMARSDRSEAAPSIAAASAASTAWLSALRRSSRWRVSHKTPARKRAALRDVYLGFGAAVLRAGDHLKGFVRLLGMLTLNIGQLVRAPHQGPWRDFSGHLYRIGATALPITALVGSLIGVVLAY